MLRSSLLVSVFMLFLAAVFPQNAAGQRLPEKSSEPEKDSRNNWGIGLDYSEGGFGPHVSYYTKAGSNSDFLFMLSFAGYSDSKEIERVDLNGNTYIENKVNRIFTMPLSLGWRVEPFKAELEGNFNPVFSIGLSPALVFYNPYEQDFFNAIDDTKVKFAAGGFTGIGFSYRQSEGTAMNMNLNYYYLPIIGGGVYSIEDSEIKNVGGFQISFSVNFLN